MNLQDAFNNGGGTGLAAGGEQTVRAPQREGFLRESETKLVLPDQTLTLNRDESFTSHKSGLPGNLELSALGIPEEGKEQM